MTTENAAREKLAGIHASLTFMHGSLNDEIEEQLMAVRFVAPQARVLELGGNVGRNSCVIGRLLNDSANLVVFECDKRNAALLTANRDANGLRFAVEPRALSARPLMQLGWDTRPYPGVLPNGWSFVDTITWPQTLAKHGAFDTLVADCEGALFHIVADAPDFFRGFKTVIIENDFHDASHKKFVDQKMREAGLACVAWKQGGWGPCADRFYEVWKRLFDVVDNASTPATSAPRQHTPTA